MRDVGVEINFLLICEIEDLLFERVQKLCSEFLFYLS